jgi:thiosulfate/3-mercaptopyruvate sulfurtransferase
VNAPGTVVVSTDWLEASLGNPDLRIVDVRGKVLPLGSHPRYVAKRSDYDRGHLPGAVFVDWTRDIVDLGDPVPVQLAPPGAFAAAMGGLGIGDGALVVAYDDYDHMFAGRLAWALRYYGHDAVRLLEGGYARWIAENRPVTSDAPVVTPVRFTPRARPALRRTADDVSRAVGRADVLLVDARPPEQYAGTSSAAARAGHIPGARNVPYATLIDASSGRFRSKDELARAFADAGIDVANLPPEVVVYCNGGVSCTVAASALALLGRDDVAVYDGSWNEWGNDPERPIRTGSKP